MSVSGSVALLGDTLHNVADALTTFPILIAFALARRPANDPPVPGLPVLPRRPPGF